MVVPRIFTTYVVAMSEMSTVRQTQTHESVLGLDQRRQGCKAKESQSVDVRPDQERRDGLGSLDQSKFQSRSDSGYRRTYTSRIGLYVDTPFCGIEVEGLQGPLAAKVFEFVDPLVTTVVPSPRKTLGILVGQNRTIGLDGGTAGQVLFEWVFRAGMRMQKKT